MLRATSFLFFLFIVSCSQKDSARIKLTHTNAEGEVPQMSDLRFGFNTDVVPDSVRHQWDSTAYVIFKPPLNGMFKWESASELVFYPREELPPATKFTATITAAIASFDPQRTYAKQTVEFYTAPLRLTSAHAFWSVAEGLTDEPVGNIRLRFNYPVNPSEVQDLVTVKVGSDVIPTLLQDATPTDQVSFALKGFPDSEEDIETRLELKAGLKPHGGQQASQSGDTRLIVFPSPYKLEILNTETEHAGVEGIVRVYTSQEVQGNGLDAFIVIDPEIEFTVSASESGMTITSQEFDANTNYELTIAKGLKGKAGGKLKTEFFQQIVFGSLRPSIRIANSKGVYVSGEGSKNMAVNIINVDNVKVTISKIYENNLMASTRYNFYSGEYDEFYDDYYYYNEGDVYELGDEIWSKAYVTAELPKQGNARLLKLDFSDKLPDYNGVYHIKVASDENYWLRDQRIISISDIGLIAKRGRDRVYVFANSIRSAASLPGVEVRLIGANNQLLDEASTNSQGVAVLALKEKHVPGFRPTLVTARLQDDFTYLPFSKTAVNTSPFEVGGKRENASGMDVFLYGERDIYRPGETINLTALVRNIDWMVPASIPMKVRLLLPNGRELASLRKTLNNEGAFEASFNLPQAAVTGSYTVEVFTSNDVLLSSKRILVEEFIPDRIKVTTRLSATESKPGDRVVLDIGAMSFFGPPAANRNYDIEFALRRTIFAPKNFSDYQFDLSDLNTDFAKSVVEGTTREDGTATEAYEIPTSYEQMGKLQLDIFTTVFDETGRPVSRRDEVDVYTQDVFYGLKSMGRYFSTGERIATNLVAVDKNGSQQTNVNAKVTVIKHEYRTVWERSGSYYRYRSQPYQRTIETKEVVVGSNTRYYFEALESGHYEIRVAQPGAKAYVSQTFYCYGFGNTYNRSFEVDNQGKIDIVADKDVYAIDEKATILFKTPFAGKLLVTIENNEVLEHFYLQTDKRSASLELAMNDRYLPNVYITATLFKAHEASELPLTVAHGIAPLVVERRSNRLPLSISAPEQSRSGTKQTIKLKTEPMAQLTVAVVDEGILQLTGYQTPDPYAYFFQKRALGVQSFDLYPYLFPELGLNVSSVGGDGFNLDKRINPLNNRRVKLTRFWSGIINADGGGNARYDIDVPKFSGNLRIMVAAYKGDAFAAASTNIRVADPIVISTALPRFLSPGDTVMVPVTISNTTDRRASGQARIKAHGPLMVAGQSTVDVSIDPKDERQALFAVVSGNAIGESKIVTSIEALGETFTEEIDLTVRPASPLLKVTGNGNVKAGSSARIKMGSASFLEGSANRTLLVSKSPAIGFAKDLEYLLRYPYGCAEQTISSAFPQLYFPQLSELLGRGNNAANTANYHVREAIKKIQMMQLYNGGLSLWPGGGYESWWTTVYAAHFLFEAKEAGFQVDDRMLNSMYAYMTARLKTREQVVYYYNRDQNRKIAPREVAYSLYVLAMAGRSQRSTMNYYKENQHLLSVDATYMLAAAYALSGDRDTYREVIPSEFGSERSNNAFGGSFYSFTRDLAISLNVLLKVDPDNPQVGQLAKILSEQLKVSKWLNTQERSFGFLALGKIARKTAASNAIATVRIDGKEIGRASDRILKLEDEDLRTDQVEIEASGEGEIYYFWEAEGISEDGSYNEEDNFLKVRRAFFDRFGRAVNGNRFKQSELVVVRISIESAYSIDVENVVISDILPAGFEIENPRIDEVPGTEWITDKSTPMHMDIRDDRINYFVNVSSSGKQNYYYMVRAVSKGTFKMGPVSADAMYNGQFHSYHGGGVVEIVEK